MNKYLISFDLDTTIGDRTKDYESVNNFVASLEFSCKPLSNVYLVATDAFNAATIRDKLIELLNVKDSILVVRLDGGYASFNYTNRNSSIKEVMHK